MKKSPLNGVEYVLFFQTSNCKFLPSYNFLKFFAFPIFRTGGAASRFFYFTVDVPIPQSEQYSRHVAENQSNGNNLCCKSSHLWVRKK